MRCPVLRLIWLKLTFSLSDVAGNNAIGHVTSERRRKPFQFARGAMTNTPLRNQQVLQFTGTIALFNAAGVDWLPVVRSTFWLPSLGHSGQSRCGINARTL